MRQRFDAKGHAAQIIEQGRATANVLAQIAESYHKGGASARDVLRMQKLVPLFHGLAGTIGELKIDRLTILPKGTGGEGQPLGAKLVDASEQIKAATGIDVPKILREAFGEHRPPRPPPRST